MQPPCSHTECPLVFTAIASDATCDLVHVAQEAAQQKALRAAEKLKKQGLNAGARGFKSIEAQVRARLPMGASLPRSRVAL